MITNIEIKARSYDNSGVRSILISNGASYEGLDHQIDTYFKNSNGRLKLRQGNIENALIYYERENKKDIKKSNVILHKFESGNILIDLLIKSLEVLVVVDKRREIYFIKNVKFHLDNVNDLGEFVEIEAIDKEGNIGIEKLTEQCNLYKNLFGIKYKDLIKDSYSDLLLKKADISRVDSKLIT